MVSLLVNYTAAPRSVGKISGKKGKPMIRTLLCILVLFIPSYSMAAIDWNDNEIVWYEYEDGINRMQHENKNGILIVYSNKCRACIEYAKMFEDDGIIKYSRDLVLIRVDRDRDEHISKKYQIDGNYVPRTYLLDSDANIITSPYKSDKYMFYLPPNNEKYLAELMRRLSKK